LSSLRGQPLVESSNITLRFDRDSAGGFAGCNWYGGRYTTMGTNLAFVDFSSTTRGCDSPPGVEDQERLFLQTMGEVMAFEIASDRLTLQARRGGDGLLLFTRRVPR
jgi:heat shock protein HslJ